eukprot:CAMPEP_0119479084 /NCGR_PEP_ID=MMETSP1344-20130328/8521_1 /TAXON_ID=236787 /ORGANISM="Florenciella parvula, Strain CCMP2471" /LENGTH=335 /DNA_ID=CAMNT_0007513299 /DNA_START=209 /DNA_END=1213 /DNA_ORIENTATION=-
MASRSSINNDDIITPLIDEEEGASDEVDAGLERDYFGTPTPPRTSLVVTLLREIGGPRCATITTVAFNMPQVVIAVVVMAIDWVPPESTEHCPDLHSEEYRWRMWCALCAIRLLLTSVVLTMRYHLMERLELPEENPRVKKATSLRNGLEAMAIVWFVIGNMWLFSSNPNANCPRSTVYWLCCAMIAAQYAQICLPCIMAVMLVPVFCFCLPCFVRLVATIHDPMQGKGADMSAIEQLPLVTYKEPVLTAAEEPEEAMGCAICLGDFVEGDILRDLPCKHQYHRGCVDQWLLVNATCPECRFSILPEGEGGDDDEEEEGGSGSNSGSNSGSGNEG